MIETTMALYLCTNYIINKPNNQQADYIRMLDNIHIFK